MKYNFLVDVIVLGNTLELFSDSSIYCWLTYI